MELIKYGWVALNEILCADKHPPYTFYAYDPPHSLDCLISMRFRVVLPATNTEGACFRSQLATGGRCHTFHTLYNVTNHMRSLTHAVLVCRPTHVCIPCFKLFSLSHPASQLPSTQLTQGAPVRCYSTSTGCGNLAAAKMNPTLCKPGLYAYKTDRGLL